MTVRHIAARIRRLEQLGIAFTREIEHFKDCDCPLLYLERVAYRDALRAAVAGLETARVVLAKARQRLTGQR
jgi:hypothetical protein